MANQKTPWLKKYWKQLLIAVAAVLVVLISVMGWHWTDTAETKFWQKTWVVLAIVCALGWASAWFYFWTKYKKK